MQEIVAVLETRGFVRNRENEQADFVSAIRPAVLEVKASTHGLRDLYGAAMRLAIVLTRQSAVQEGALLIAHSRLSMGRLRSEWLKILQALAPQVRQQLRMIVVQSVDHVWTEPRDEYWQEIGQAVAKVVGRGGRAPGCPDTVAKHPSTPTAAFADVLKLLLHRWLFRQGATTVPQLAAEAGCSVPTARRAVVHLREARVIARPDRTGDLRSVELLQFPASAWREIVVLDRSFRQTVRYADVSGNPRSPEALLRRLEQLRPAHVAVGGVVAARHWDAGLDLNGLPRLDLILHSPKGQMTTPHILAQQVDPALRPVDEGDPRGVLLAIHILRRAVSLFHQPAPRGISIADPVEAALDLYDLRLEAQAGQLLRSIRPEARA